MGHFVAASAGEKLWRHIGGRSGDVFRRKILDLRQTRDAEVEQFQAAILEQQNIVRLDVAVNDPGAMEGRDGARDTRRKQDSLALIDGRLAFQPLLQIGPVFLFSTTYYRAVSEKLDAVSARDCPIPPFQLYKTGGPPPWRDLPVHIDAAGRKMRTVAL
jgi:hypothetical protein